MKKQIIKSWYLLAFALIIPTNITYAYLDPGSGSLIIQLLVAAILGGLVTIRMFWSKILTLFWFTPNRLKMTISLMILQKNKDKVYGFATSTC